MIETTVRDAMTPAIGRGHWCFHEIGKSREPAKIADDLIAETFHGRYVAINATHGQDTVCVNRNIIVEPDGDNAYMDVNSLKRLMEEHGESQAEIGRLLNLTRDKINKVLKGKRRLTVQEADTLRRYFSGIDGKESESSAFELPIVGLVSAGAWREGFERELGRMPSPDKSLSRDSFVVLVEGDSMDLVAQPGEGIVVDPRDRDLLAGRYYVVRNNGGETTFKKYMDNPARLEPCSSNPLHKTIFPGQDGFEVIGRARKRVSDL